jgi:hypothetical protein
MDEMIDVLAQKVLNNLSGYSRTDAAQMLMGIADKLYNYADMWIEKEYKDDVWDLIIKCEE